MEENINSIKEVVEATAKQLDQLLQIEANNQQILANVIQIMNMQSQNINQLNQQFQQLYLKVCDMEITTHVNGDSVGDTLEECKQLSIDVQEISNKIDHLKIYKTVYEGDM